MKNYQGHKLWDIEVCLPLGCSVCLVCRHWIPCVKAFRFPTNKRIGHDSHRLAEISCRTLNFLWSKIHFMRLIIFPLGPLTHGAFCTAVISYMYVCCVKIDKWEAFLSAWFNYMDVKSREK